MKAIMYHYVRPADAGIPPHDYYTLSLVDFREQLDYFQSEYEFTSRERFDSIRRGEATPREDELVLTFDDGLVDHYEWVLPELEQRDLWAFFFVNTGPLSTGRPLVVHRIHALLGRCSISGVAETVLDSLDEFDHPEMDPDRHDALKPGTDRQTQVAAIKSVLNRTFDLEMAADVLDRVERVHYDDPLALADELYLDDEQLQALEDSGMVVGAHSVAHPYLSSASNDRQRREVRKSVERVESVCESPVRAFSYPFGDYDDMTLSAVADAGCDVAFTTEARDIGVDDIDKPLRLPRRDCNEFPHGQATFDFS